MLIKRKTHRRKKHILCAWSSYKHLLIITLYHIHKIKSRLLSKVPDYISGALLFVLITCTKHILSLIGRKLIKVAYFDATFLNVYKKLIFTCCFLDLLSFSIILLQSLNPQNNLHETFLHHDKYA